MRFIVHGALSGYALFMIDGIGRDVKIAIDIHHDDDEFLLAKRQDIYMLGKVLQEAAMGMMDNDPELTELTVGGVAAYVDGKMMEFGGEGTHPGSEAPSPVDKPPKSPSDSDS